VTHRHLGLQHTLLTASIHGCDFFSPAEPASSALDAGHDVTILDALLPTVHAGGWPTYLDDRAERVLADVREVTDRQVAGFDVVVHQAAKVGLGVDLDDLPEYVSHNEYGTAVLLAAMARTGVQRLVLASSMVVYGEGGYTCAAHGSVRPGPRKVADLDAGRFEAPCPYCGQPLTLAIVPEDSPLDPRNAYAASKTAQEHLAASWARGANGTAVALRYHNVYGPQMPQGTPYAGVASLFRSALERGAAPRVFEDGHQSRDFVHVSDVAAANVLALTAGTPGSLTAYNVASGTSHTVGQMAQSLSSAKAREELGFVALNDFAAGMKEFATAPLREAIRA
jgi:dTDP-L-rhamnose 4-epimerase